MSTAEDIWEDEGEEGVSADLDQRVYLSLDWQAFVDFLRVRGDQAGTRVTYLDGTLELMGSSTSHEADKKKLARLVETYAAQLGIPLEGYGSWTLKDGRKKGGVEPDECYVRGVGPRRRPDLAIEVIHTSGGLSKLEAYRRLGVGEVWFWRRGQLSVFRLEDGAYSPAERSGVLPEMDLARIARCMGATSQTEALAMLGAPAPGA